MSEFDLQVKGTKHRVVTRLFELVRLLLEGPKTRNELIAGMDPGDGESASTLSRDIALIKELELLEFEGNRPYRARPTRNLPLWLASEEALALEVARIIMEQLGLPEAETIQSLTERIPEGIRRPPKGMPLMMAPTLRDFEPGIWETLLEGISRGRKIRLYYQPPQAPEPYWAVVDRARLIWMTNAFYLCAFRPDYAREKPDLPPYTHVREYRIDRIKAVELLNDSVELPELPTVSCSILLDEELTGRLSDLKDARGRWVQKVEKVPGVGIRMRFEEVGLLRARQRALMFGDHLLAIEHPPELREIVESMTQRLAERFASTVSRRLINS